MTARNRKTPDECDKEALIVLVQWRDVDRHAIANKADPIAKRTEYAVRKKLRTAADNLTEARNG